MALVIQPYRAEHESAVQEFNDRVQRAVGDPNLVFYRFAEPRWLPRNAGNTLFQEFFVATDGTTVRGGYALKTQEFVFPDGTVRRVAYYHHPLSEGIADKAFAIVGALLLRDAMTRSPLLYCLGMGGYDRPLPKMLIGLGWTHFLMPFYFKVLHPARFLRHMEALRGSPARRLLMDSAAFTGAGWLASRAFDAYCVVRAQRPDPVSVEEVPYFSDWADTVWNETKRGCSHGAVRDASTLHTLYPASLTHLTRLRVTRRGRDLGWAVVGERRSDPKYGNMRVGSLVDCWGVVGEELAIVRSATHTLREQGFDLILTNQSHVRWCAALQANGYLSGPSNFIYAASKKLIEHLSPFAPVRPLMHFNRADGDGLPQNF
jgi:hypothetical protein